MVLIMALLIRVENYGDQSKLIMEVRSDGAMLGFHLTSG